MPPLNTATRRLASANYLHLFSFSMSRNSNINIYPLLFEDPYGPYLENEVLTDACRDVGAKLLPLTNFMMECGGKCIG